MFDLQLAQRIRDQLDGIPDVTERRMFGGLSFLIAGHMACGVVGNDLVLRLGKNDAAATLDQPHTRPMDFTGRPIRSMIYIAPDGTARDRALNHWIKRSIKYVSTLPPKDLTADCTPPLKRPTASGC
jgi:TfoX/Sxy family transcriptional regulator of competence genes